MPTASARLRRSGSDFQRYLGKQDINTVLKVAIAGTGIAVGIYAAYKIVQSLTPSCNDPASPCYQATQPFIQQYNACQQQYTGYLAQFVREDSVAGTGLTALQHQVLDGLTKCMTDAQNGLVAAAQKFNTPQEAFAFSIQTVGVAVAVGVGAVLGSKAVNILRSLRTVPRTAAGGTGLTSNAVVSTLADSGEISAASVAGFSSDINALTSTLTTEDAFILENTYVGLELLTLDQAIGLAGEDAFAFEGDAAATIARLALI